MKSEPIYLGAPGQELFGMFHGQKGTERLPVLLVPPFGYEAVWSHRALRLLAEQISDEGHPVLRLDPFGCGDSAGDDRSENLVERWIESIVLGVDWLSNREEERPVLLVGLRLSALLCLAASARLGEKVAGGALIVPVLQGRAFCRELRAFRAMQDQGVQKPEEGTEEASGYILRQETIAALGKLKATELAVSGRWIVYTLGEGASEGPLVKHLSADVRPATGYSEMMQVQEKSVPPTELFSDLGKWLLERFTHTLSVPNRLSTTRAQMPVPNVPERAGEKISENALWLGDDRKIFAIVAKGESQAASASKPCILLLNWGCAYHIGATRLPVIWSRVWASRGYTVARIDLGGIGETAPAAGQRENNAYASTMSSDVGAALRALQKKYGATRFVAMGLCAGAWTSFHSSLAHEAIVGTVLINPLEFYWREGMSLEVGSSRVQKEAAEYKKSALSVEKWKKLLSGGVNVRHLAKIVQKRGVAIAKARGKRALGRYAPGDNIARDLYRLGEAGKKVALVFSEGEVGISYLEDNIGRDAFERLRARHGIDMRVFGGPDHTFSPLWTQPLLTAYLTEFLAKNFG